MEIRVHRRTGGLEIVKISFCRGYIVHRRTGGLEIKKQPRYSTP